MEAYVSEFWRVKIFEALVSLEGGNGCRRSAPPGVLANEIPLHTKRVRDRRAAAKSRMPPPLELQNPVLVWRRRRKVPNKKSGIAASKLQGSQTTRLSYWFFFSAANVPQGKLAQFLENGKGDWPVPKMGVPIRYGIVPFMGFLVCSPSSTPRIFLFLLSHF